MYSVVLQLVKQIITKGEIPITKNIRVIDEQGNEHEATDPKRAKGLVKNGRARFVDENKICLACPPDKILEEEKMSNPCDSFSRAEMVGFTPTVAKQYYEEFMQEARDAGAPEEILTPYKELIEALPVYVNHSEYVRYLHIPSSVTSIGVESLSYLMIENTYDTKSPDKGVVLPVFDLKTTQAIRANLVGIIFSQSTSSEGYERLSNFAIYSPEEPEGDILAWHYVDGVPTLWK